ncbi:MAG: FAD binding domain-containing protein [Acidobacteria bacterium]|nr:FAD binding domain-containing protein [Acidobacteriota bacterium]MCB9397491.1 FAD binding domain-containing protein [Acidobacteriota bacterium]
MSYCQPTQLSDLLSCLAHPNARILAGGTDLIPHLQMGLVEDPLLVSLKGLPELKRIEAKPEAIHIGPAVTLQTLIDHKPLREIYPVIGQTLSQIGALQHRQVGTIGGNLCLDTRCSWFNQSAFWRESLGFCLKKGGDICQVAPKSKRCHAVLSCDGAIALAACQARLVLLSRAGKREVSLMEFYRPNGMDHIDLRPGEFIYKILLPHAPPGFQATYFKGRARQSFDFPLLGLAIATQWDGAQRTLSFVLGGVESCLLQVQMQNLDSFLTPEQVQSAIKSCQRLARPMENAFYGPSWRKKMIASFIAQGLQQMNLIQEDAP